MFSQPQGWFGLREPSRAFSAIVRKDGSTVWAEDASGKTLASGEAGVDDASVIQSALDRGGKIILSGEFYLSEKIVLNIPANDNYNRACVEGVGKSVLHRQFNGDALFEIIYNYPVRGQVIIANLVLNGHGTDGYVGNGIYAHSEPTDKWTYDITFNNITVVDFSSGGDTTLGRGLIIKGISEKRVLNSLFGWNEEGGILFDTGTGQENGWIDKTTVTGNKVGIEVINVPDLRITNCKIAGFTDAGIYLHGSCHNVTIENIHFAISKTSNYALRVVGESISIKNITFGESGTLDTAIYMEYGRGAKISNCRFANPNMTTHLNITSNWRGLIFEQLSKDATPIDFTKVVNNGVDVIFRGAGFENSGVATFSGDGTTTQFSIAHGLVSTPTKIQVTPMTADAASDFYVTADDTNIYINYKSAPPSGTDNLKFSWYAEV